MKKMNICPEVLPQRELYVTATCQCGAYKGFSFSCVIPVPRDYDDRVDGAEKPVSYPQLRALFEKTSRRLLPNVTAQHCFMQNSIRIGTIYKMNGSESDAWRAPQGPTKY